MNTKRKAREALRSYYKTVIGNKGTYIMQEDWDNLIILDGYATDKPNKNPKLSNP